MTCWICWFYILRSKRQPILQWWSVNFKTHDDLIRFLNKSKREKGLTTIINEHYATDETTVIYYGQKYERS